MSIESIQLEAGKTFTDLRSFLNLNTDKDSKAIFYALLETIQDRLDKIDLTQVEKGAILTDLVTNLIEQNEQELTLFREVKRAVQEGKSATKH